MLCFTFLICFNVEKKMLSKKTATIDPIQTGLVWFSSDYILKVNRTKSNRILIYLAVRMTFSLKTEPNRTANTPKYRSGRAIWAEKHCLSFFFIRGYLFIFSWI